MTAIESARQTLLILLPEFLILVSATVMMTAGAFVKLPRSSWSIASAATLVVSLLALVLLRDQVTDPYGRSPSTMRCRDTAGSSSYSRA